MAFAGTMGAGALMTPIGVLSAPGGALTYAADGISLLKTDSGTATPILRPSIANLIFTMADGPGDPVLTEMVAGAPDEANDDTGMLSTADVVGGGEANKHGIPANWGAGRGNWDADSVARINVQIRAHSTNRAGVGDVGGSQVASIALVGSDVEIAIRNTSLEEVEDLTVLLEYRHSMNLG